MDNHTEERIFNSIRLAMLSLCYAMEQIPKGEFEKADKWLDTAGKEIVSARKKLKA